MTVKELIGTCADRNMKVVIYDNYSHPITSGNVMELFTSNCEELLKSKVYCFYCNNKKFHITLKEVK